VSGREDADGRAARPLVEERIEGETPHGGCLAVLTYLDDAGAPADKDAATRGVGREYDSEGNLIFETWMRFEPGPWGPGEGGGDA
jgi:hypothetical protein